MVRDAEEAGFATGRWITAAQTAWVCITLLLLFKLLLTVLAGHI
jgi:hypothetical protein